MANSKLTIAVGADHAGYEYKQLIVEFLKEYNIKDFGTYSRGSVDYADFAHPLSLSVESAESDLGILICGSANGVAMTANKHAGIRAAVCWTEELAGLARKHNNANVLCIPARFISTDEAKSIVQRFLHTEFEGGRHENRVNKIPC